MICLAATFGFVQMVAAWPTSLNVIPIADLLRHRELYLQYSVNGAGKLYSHSAGATVGLFDRIEIGVDTDFLGYHTYNAKALIVDSPKWAKGIMASVGVCNARGGYREPYLAMSYEFEVARIHAGYWRTESTNTVMLGTDFWPFPNATGMIEHISGPNGVTWAGLYYELPALPGLSIGAAVGVPNRKSDGTQHFLFVGYGIKF